MSYNKHTRENEVIDFVEEVLDHVGVEYKSEIIGTAHGYDALGEPFVFNIRRLEVQGRDGERLVLRERMERSEDCDSDDIIEVYGFYRDREPKNFGVELLPGQPVPTRETP